MWFKVKDDCYIDLNEICAVRASMDNYTLWVLFKHSGEMGYGVDDASNTVRRIMNILTCEEGELPFGMV